MNTQQLGAAVRTLLMVIGSYFLGKTFFGLPIDQVLWQQIAGIAFTIGALLWSVFSKTLTAERWQGAIRQAITFIGGLLLARGVVTAEVWQSILAVIVAVLPFVQSYQSKVSK